MWHLAKLLPSNRREVTPSSSTQLSLSTSRISGIDRPSQLWPLSLFFFSSCGSCVSAPERKARDADLLLYLKRGLGEQETLVVTDETFLVFASARAALPSRVHGPEDPPSWCKLHFSPRAVSSLGMALDLERTLSPLVVIP